MNRAQNGFSLTGFSRKLLQETAEIALAFARPWPSACAVPTSRARQQANCREPKTPSRLTSIQMELCPNGDMKMLRAGLLWLLGVPVFVIIMLALFTGIL